MIGEEPDVLRAIADLAARPAAGLNRQDAAMVSFQISVSMGGRPQPPLGGSR
jgi:hypothetical protein